MKVASNCLHLGMDLVPMVLKCHGSDYREGDIPPKVQNSGTKRL
jgi:hypothetical protein